jgi:SAM-dependent methyltransferase
MPTVCADATHLPFRKHVFDSIVSLETLEHIRDQMAFLNNIKEALKKSGKLILSTPNKMCTSPFLPKPLDPFHISEFYLGSLLNFLRAHSFRVDYVYGGKRVRKSELLRRILGSLLKFFLEQSLFEALLAGRLLLLNLQFDIDESMETFEKAAPNRP